MKIEENNRMGKTRESVKRIREVKGMSHARMNIVKCRNSKDLREREERWQEFKGTIQKKGLNDPVNHDGVITHLEPDIL